MVTYYTHLTARVCDEWNDPFCAQDPTIAYRQRQGKQRIFFFSFLVVGEKGDTVCYESCRRRLFILFISRRRHIILYIPFCMYQLFFFFTREGIGYLHKQLYFLDTEGNCAQCLFTVYQWHLSHTLPSRRVLFVLLWQMNKPKTTRSQWLGWNYFD